MSITLNIWSGKSGTRVYFNDAEGNALGFFERKLAGQWSREANSFTNTVPADIFAKALDFVVPSYFGRDVERSEENIYQALAAHCADKDIIGMNAKDTKAKKAAQKARAAAFTTAFA